jgi:hypothetical protein
MGMEVVVFINGRTVASLQLVRQDPSGPTEPGVGTGSYRATLRELNPLVDVIEGWIVTDHDRSSGVWGLVADALAQRPEGG